MFADIRNAAGQGTNPLCSRRGNRSIVAAALLAATLLLGACGGGGDDGGGGGGGGGSLTSVNIGVVVDGQPPGQFVVAPGGAIDVAIRVNDSVILDAVEPVFWTMLVGGAAVPSGVTVSYAGALITATELDSFAVAVDTFADFRLAGPIPITLIATSSFDGVQVASVNILITN